MLDPTAFILADRATRRHVRSAGPSAPTTAPPRRRGHAARRLTVAALRRLVDRIEPRCAPGAAASRPAT